MNAFIEPMFDYFGHFKETAWNWYFPLCMVGAFALIVGIFYLLQGSFSSKTNENDTVTKKILVTLYWSGIITTTLSVLSVIILLLFSSFFGRHHCQAGVLFGFALILTATLCFYAGLCHGIRQRRISILRVPLSERFMNERVKNLKHLAGRLLLFFLINGLAFLLLLLPTRQSNLISLVVDNSTSMEYNLQNGVSNIEKALGCSPHKNTYVFTTLLNGDSFKDGLNGSQYIQNIVNKQPSQLSAQTSVYFNTQFLVNAFNQMGFVDATYLFEGIWQNYTEAEKLSGFHHKKMIVFSDGEDFWYHPENSSNKTSHPDDIFQQAGKSGKSPLEFYDAIYGIYVGGDGSNDFWNRNSFTEIADGTTSAAYFNALVDFLPELYFDRYLLWAIGFLLTLYFILICIYYFRVH